jgi:hypothetical protein
MTQLEKDQKLADLKTRQEMLDNERRALEAVPVTIHKVWEPRVCENYFDALGARESTNTGHWVDEGSIETGLAHPTKEAAERHHSFLVMLHDLHKFAVEENEGWKPGYGENDNHKWQLEFDTIRMEIGKVCYRTYGGVLPCFQSQDIAQKAIDTFGDRLKILFEYYNS